MSARDLEAKRWWVDTLLMGIAHIWFLLPRLLHRCGTLLSGIALPLEKFFSDEEIQLRVVRLRIRIAKKRHDEMFLFNMNTKNRNPHRVTFGDASNVCKMMPARRTWRRPRSATRRKLSAQKIAEVSVIDAIQAARRSNQNPDWLAQLGHFVGQVQGRLRNVRRISFAPPRVALIPKDVIKKTYRPLALFPMQDQIFVSLAAGHLRATLDELFYEESYAFRAYNSRLGRTPQHHDAMDALRNYITANRRKLLYVAECDIQKFFDIVNHQVAKDALTSLLVDLRRTGKLYDRGLLKIYSAYLKAYNYTTSVDHEAPDILKRMGVEGGTVPWVKSELEAIYAPHPVPHEIGVPQGGALSPIIANIVLHSADRAIALKAVELGTSDYFYARYCDDMIIVSPQADITKQLFEAYIDELKRLKLPFHVPKSIEKFSASFFEMKSRSTYSYGPPALGAISPWITFLGYQVRYDGRLRVRKASMEKEMKKQVEVYETVLRSIGHGTTSMRVSAGKALHSTKMRLHAMSVGRSDIHHHGTEFEHEMCWATGFELLKKRPHVRSQLKRLDRVRARLLRQLRERLETAGLPKPGLHAEKGHHYLRFYGRPFSYFAQFSSSDKPKKSS
ncbi:MAG TPA: reverse transcriptase domain-containing protein [Rhizomicrobium sp.]